MGYASIDLDEFAEVFGGLLAIMGPGHVSAYPEDGEDVGFAFVYPDYVEDIRALGRARRRLGRMAWEVPRDANRRVDVRPRSRGTAIIGSNGPGGLGSAARHHRWIRRTLSSRSLWRDG